jgi:hypothetical protein
LKKILRERHEHRTHELGATQKWLETLLAAGAAKLCAAVATYPHEVLLVLYALLCVKKVSVHYMAVCQHI